MKQSADSCWRQGTASVNRPHGGSEHPIPGLGPTAHGFRPGSVGCFSCSQIGLLAGAVGTAGALLFNGAALVLVAIGAGVASRRLREM